MRITFGGLFIAMGVTLLWLAATGNLDRLSKAWDIVTAKGDDASAPESSNGAASGLALPPLPNVRPSILQMPNLPTLG